MYNQGRPKQDQFVKVKFIKSKSINMSLRGVLKDEADRADVLMNLVHLMRLQIFHVSECLKHQWKRSIKSLNSIQ